MANESSVIGKPMELEESAIRYKVLVQVLGRNPDSAEARHLRVEIKGSPLVGRLLSERDEQGRIPHHPYTKWDGAHWVLAQLADIGYPAGDTSSAPMAEQVIGWLLGSSHQKSIQTIDGRVRRRALQKATPSTLYWPWAWPMLVFSETKSKNWPSAWPSGSGPSQLTGSLASQSAAEQAADGRPSH